MASTKAAPIPFAGSKLSQYRHVCAFFSTPDEEYRTLLPFIREGLDRGERAYHVIDPDLREDHLLRLRNAGIDVAATQRTKQLEVLAPRDTYLRGGHFDKWAMIELIQEALRAGVPLGFPITRLIAHAEAVLEDSRNAGAWVEYESRLNYVLPRFADPVICTYDSRKLDAAVASDVLRTHPVAVVGGLLQLNPFFVPPDELLRELDERYSAPESRDPGPTQ